MFGSFIIVTLSCIIGTILGNIIFAFWQAYKLRKQCLTSNYFKDTDFDFFNDSDDSKSITDVDIEKVKEEL